MLGAAQADRDDIAVTVGYIRDRRDQVFRLDERASRLGIDYVEIHERNSFDPAVWSALRRLVREREIDIVHAHEYKTDLLALMLGQAEPIVPLATVHGWTGHSARERWFYYPCDRWVLARFPRLIAVSGQIKDDLVASGAQPERVTVVLNAIDPAAFKRDTKKEAAARAALGLHPDQFVIGAVGRLEPQKRFDLLIDAVAMVHRSHPNVRLLIAGDGSLQAPLAHQLATRLSGGVGRLLGHVDQVSDLHHALDLLVQSSDYEGTPNAVLEAMAFETPVIATAAGGTAEVAHDQVHALIIPPGSASAIAERITLVIADPDGTRRRAAAARQRVEHELSFRARMRAVESIYRELVSSSDRKARRSGFLQWA